MSLANIRGGIAVKPHVQAFADAAQKETGVNSFGTYVGHEPTPDRAVDCFATKEQGDRLSAWAIRPEIIEFYGIDYVIWWQQIYNPEISKSWRNMADRGGITQNHKDHVHVSFEPTGQASPNNQQEEDFMASLTEEEKNELVKAAKAFNHRTVVAGVEEDMEWAAKNAHIFGFANSQKLDSIIQSLTALEEKAGTSSGAGDHPTADQIADEIANRMKD